MTKKTITQHDKEILNKIEAIKMGVTPKNPSPPANPKPANPVPTKSKRPVKMTRDPNTGQFIKKKGK